MSRKLKNSFFNETIHFLYRFKTQGTQAGQGLIEYLLLLVLTVSIIAGVMNGLGRPASEYMKNVYGLIGCMLRVGEGPRIALDLCGGMPSLEVDTEALNAGGGSGSGAAGNSNNNNNTDSNSDDQSGGNDGASGSDQGPSITPQSNRGSIDGRGRGGGGNSNFDSDPLGSRQSNRIKIKSDEAGSDGSFNYSGFNQDTVIVRRIRRNDGGQIGGGFSLVNREESINAGDLSSATPPPVKKKAPPGPEVGRRRVSSFTVSTNKRRQDTGSMYEEEESFSFMKLVKWAIIIAIIFIFGAFTLSQLNSIRKGWTD